jgi:hypothetical protein
MNCVKPSVSKSFDKLLKDITSDGLRLFRDNQLEKEKSENKLATTMQKKK